MGDLLSVFTNPKASPVAAGGAFLVLGCIACRLAGLKKLLKRPTGNYESPTYPQAWEWKLAMLCCPICKPAAYSHGPCHFVNGHNMVVLYVHF
jgi:hypothetical protein